MGLFSSLFGGKSKTKSSSESLPWADVIPYLTGEGGIFPEAQSLYEQGGFTPSMQNAADVYRQHLTDRYNSPLFDGVLAPGAMALGGSFDPNVSRVRDIQRMQDPTGAIQGFQGDTRYVNPGRVDLVSARAGQGQLDPTNSLSSLLSGMPSNPYLDQQAQAITGQLTRNLNENVMPGIRSDAVASGQYGGSRQGIAEGLAMSRMNQDLAPALTSLYGGAYENAQNRMMGTALPLNEQAFANEAGNVNRDFAGQQFNAQLAQANTDRDFQRQQFNAQLGQANTDRDFQRQQFNANLGLQNNQQSMQAAGQNLSNRAQGLGLLSGGLNMQDTIYDQFQNLNAQPNQMDWQNLNNYFGVMLPGAQLGGTTKGKNTSTSTPGIIPSILGTAAGIAGIGGMMGGFGGMGGGMSGISGMSAANNMNRAFPASNTFNWGYGGR